MLAHTISRADGNQHASSDRPTNASDDTNLNDTNLNDTTRPDMTRPDMNDPT